MLRTWHFDRLLTGLQGYLRCGKVLQLKGENKLALKIYERGLNKVKIGANTDKDRVVSFGALDRSIFVNILSEDPPIHVQQTAEITSS